MGKAFSLSLLRMMLDVGFSDVDFMILRKFPFIPSFFECFLIMKGWWICLMLLPHQLRLQCDFFLHPINVGIMWTYFAFLEYVPLGHGVQSSHYAADFNFLVFCWDFLLQYPWGMLVCSFLFLHCLCQAWISCNADFITPIRKCSLIFNFWGKFERTGINSSLNPW